jgi:hypothetical protein
MYRQFIITIVEKSGFNPTFEEHLTLGCLVVISVFFLGGCKYKFFCCCSQHFNWLDEYPSASMYEENEGRKDINKSWLNYTNKVLKMIQIVWLVEKT